jgi:murein DD-endopeptidase MepM/ murein hydrolase activator NlpD
MSSLHQDPLLVEGSEPATGSASTLATARGTSRRPAEEKATTTVPTQRLGTAQRSGSTGSITDGAASVTRTRRTAGAKAGAAAADTLASPAKAATDATAKAAIGATAKLASAKAATGKAATSVTATAPKATAPEATVAELSPTVGTSPVRPTPHKRTAPVADVITPVAEPLDSLVDAAVEAPAVVASVAAEGRRSRFLRRRPPSLTRRPALYLAAALIGAMGVSAVSTDGPTAQATETVSHSVSVAEELGIQATAAKAITDTDATELLGELAVSRNVREAEQAAAAQVQAEADRLAAEAAAEAARPKAVLPVAGARLTSGFGPRWGTLHAGIDLAAPMHTPEYAAMDGVVLEAGPASGYGLVVYIQHENGDVTVYGHMDSILVEAGQVVRAGDTIALLGNRGQSTGPHLHFEVHVGGLNGEKIDPLPWLRERGVAI